MNKGLATGGELFQKKFFAAKIDEEPMQQKAYLKQKRSIATQIGSIPFQNLRILRLFQP